MEIKEFLFLPALTVVYTVYFRLGGSICGQSYGIVASGCLDNQGVIQTT